MRSVSRRNFLQFASASGVMACCLPTLAGTQAPLTGGAPNAEKLGWRLGCQAYTFNRFTFFEALDKIKLLGLRYVEMYPGQALSPDRREIRTNDSMPPEIREELKTRLKQMDIQLVCYGVVGLPNNEVACRRVFDFAKDMGIETIVSEPPPEAFDLLERLAEEYQINVAIHNHPEPSRYWNPDTVLEVCKGRSKRIGACADTGHWMRSGINPLEAIRKLEGRIISFHFKDLNKYGKQGSHDVPWGTGQANVRAILEELYRQKFRGVFSAEYEHNWENNLPELAECVRFFEQVARELLQRA